MSTPETYNRSNSLHVSGVSGNHFRPESGTRLPEVCIRIGTVVGGK